MDFKRTRPIQRGDIYYADLTPVTGSEQGGIRPAACSGIPLSCWSRFGRWTSPAWVSTWAAWVRTRCGKWTPLCTSA